MKMIWFTTSIWTFTSKPQHSVSITHIKNLSTTSKFRTQRKCLLRFVLLGLPKMWKRPKQSHYLASPPVRVASTTCSLSMRNMNTARFCEGEWGKITSSHFWQNFRYWLFSVPNEIKTALYLRSIGLLLPDGDLISEDGSIVFNHHRLFFNVSGSKQPQALWANYTSSYSFCSQETEAKGIGFVPLQLWLLLSRIYSYNTHLDAGAAQVDIGSPLALHPAVLGGPGVHYWRLGVGGAAFSLGYILVRPGTAAGYNLRLWPWSSKGIRH